MKIGTIILNKRHEKGWKQEELAEIAKLKSRSSLSYIEKYSRMPNFDVAVDLCYALDMTPNDLAKKMGMAVRQTKEEKKLAECEKELIKLRKDMQNIRFVKGTKKSLRS
jgi:transcriptional regulator with XRE-family HTH domain